MPLRPSSDGFNEGRDGFYFAMTEGTKTVQCVVTHQALRELSASNGLPGDQVATFTRFRSEIERAASNKFDAGKFNENGEVSVTPTDFNP